jgi:hypothetical protein
MRLPTLHTDQDGMMTITNAVAVMFCILLIVFLLNVSFVTKQKVELQNGADAIAATTGALAARHMNALTATNHVIGEALGLVIVHDAIGGAKLDADAAEDTREFDLNLDAALAEYVDASKAAKLPPTPTAYDTVRDAVRASKEKRSMEYLTKTRLKKLLAEVYWQQAAARWMVAAGYAGAEALHTALEPREAQILAEYEFLNMVHARARALVKFKKRLRDVVLPEAKQYTVDLVETYPKRAAAAVGRIAELNGVDGMALNVRGKLALPVEIDPHAKEMTLITKPKDTLARLKPGCCYCPIYRTAITRDQLVKITQLSRATFPWVNYHRQPVLEMLSPLVLCEAQEAYKDATDGYTKLVCSNLQLDDDHDLGLYVLKGYPAPDKWHALWTMLPDRADEVFGTLAVAHRPRPTVVGEPFAFRQQHATGSIAVSQVLLYNANTHVRPEQPIDLTCKRIVPNRQADVGWDTLNWAPKQRPYELVAKVNQGAMTAEYPRIRVNWQAKLVPVSDRMFRSLHTNRSRLLPQVQPVVERLLDQLPPALQTH